MRKLQLSGFGGVVTSINPRILPNNASQAQLNVRVEGGKIKVSYGFIVRSNPQTNLTAVLGWKYLQGYSGTTENEEYVSAETRSGNTRFYSRPADDCDPATEITNGGVSVNVHASEWVFQPYEDVSFFINPNNTSPVYRHTIGTINSLTAIAIPTAPAAAPTYAVVYGGGSTPYNQLSFAGINVATEITYTGAAHSTDSSVGSDGAILIGHANSKVASSFKIDLSLSTAGQQDFSYNDNFGLVLTSQNSSFEISGLAVEFENASGTRLVPTRSQVVVFATQTGKQWNVTLQSIDKDRSLFDDVKYLKVSYNVIRASSTASNNILRLDKPFIGGVDMSTDRNSGQFKPRKVAYSYYFSTPQFESGISPILEIPWEALEGYSPSPGIGELGVQIELTLAVSGDANVDQFRVYEFNEDTNKYHRLGSQADSDSTFDFKIMFIEAIRLPEYEPAPFTFANVSNACSYKGSMVWFYNVGADNVRFSRVGDPLRQASTDDVITDDNRGRTMTLADNAADIPLGGIQAGDSVMIAGKDGVYVTFGDFPAQMTFIRKVSGSFGVAGKYAFCRWKSDNGLPGMAYVSRDGQVYFATPGGPATDEVGDNIILTGPIREGEFSLREFFIDGQPDFAFTDFSTAQVVSDDQQEALVIAMGKRRLVLRRPDINGTRSWEPEERNTGGDTVSIRYLDGSTKRRVRGIRSNGYVDEWEFNSTTGLFIEGENRDGGNPLQNIYYTTKTFVGENSRAAIVRAYREGNEGAIVVTDYTSFTPSGGSVSIQDEKIAARLPVSAQGTEHRFKFELEEDSPGLDRVEIEMNAIPMRRMA